MLLPLTFLISGRRTPEHLCITKDGIICQVTGRATPLQWENVCSEGAPDCMLQPAHHLKKVVTLALLQVARLSRDELAIRKAILAYGAALEIFIPGESSHVPSTSELSRLGCNNWVKYVLCLTGWHTG